MSTASTGPDINAAIGVGATSERPITLRFTGKGGEYFRIWIVNVVLTILTLGIYSAWAKVRRNRYIYGNTFLDNANFEYHAKPSKILIGRIFALILFAIWTIVNQFAPQFADRLGSMDFGPPTWGILEWTLAITGFFYVIAAIVAPYLISMSMKFRLRNSSHRNVRFRFLGGYGGAFKAYVVWGIAAALSAFLLYPVFAHRRMRYFVDNAKYGMEKFQFSGKVGPLYPIYIVAGILFLLSFAPYGIFMYFVVKIIESQADGEDISNFDPSTMLEGFPAWMVTAGGVVLIILYLALFCVAFAWVKSRTINYRWNNTSLRNTRFSGTMRARSLAWIYLTNLLAIMFSFGLLAAWAKMRTIRYRVQNVTMLLRDDLDQFVGRAQASEAALAEEAADIMDLDFGL